MARDLRQAEAFALDDEGRPDGFQVGRSAALLDWQFRKENDGFERLCRRLYAKKWARAFRLRHPERARQYQKTWRIRHADEVRSEERARRYARRTKTIAPNTCAECGTMWTPIPGRGRKARFCTTVCRNRWHCRPRVKAKNRGLRNMCLQSTVLAILRAEPGLTLKEIHARAAGSKYGSLATKLSLWTKKGLLARTNGRYALARSPE